MTREAFSRELAAAINRCGYQLSELASRSGVPEDRLASLLGGDPGEVTEDEIDALCAQLVPTGSDGTPASLAARLFDLLDMAGPAIARRMGI